MLAAVVKPATAIHTHAGADPFAVIAPSNEALAALAAGWVLGLLKPDLRCRLEKVLTCHVVAGKVIAKAMMSTTKADGGMHEVKTVGACVRALSLKSKKVLMADEVGCTGVVISADLRQPNGVIHGVNKVLLPIM